jgi:hypothetical protein
LQLFDLRSDETTSFEKEYRRILEEYRVENYYYSCTYDLTNPLARNMIISATPLYDILLPNTQLGTSIYSEESEFLGICETFQYNHSQIEEFYKAIRCKKWVLSVVHGFCKHISMYMAK